MKSPLRGRQSDPSDDNASGANSRVCRALEALREVLAAAQARGVELAASYQHFDRSAGGVVGVDDLLAALDDLHLRSPATIWDERDASDCLELLTLGKSRMYCSRDDFIRFFAAATNPGGVSTSPTGKKTHKPVESPLRSRPQGIENGGSPVVMTVPKSRKKPQVTLPDWAHARSKRALSELESLQRRRGHKRGKQFQLSSLVASSPGFFESSVGEEEENNNASTRSPGGQNGSPATEGIARLPLKSVSPHKRDDHSHVMGFRVDSADRVFDIDDEHAISYRILTHDVDSTAKTETNEESARLRAVFLQVLAAKSSEHDSDLLDLDDAPATLAPFRLTVFIDVFQSLETLATFFDPLLVHFPRGKVLLCGHPTRSKKSTAWSSDVTADAYGKLLNHLTTQSREWLVQPKTGVGAVPQYLIGIGTGASTALQFLGMNVPLNASSSPSLQSFAHSLRGLVLINSVVSISDAVRSNMQSLRALLHRPSSDAMPLHEAILSLLFSEHYLTQVVPSRRAAMETFFRTRREFFVGGGDGGGDTCNNSELLRLLIRGVLKSKDAHGAAANLSTIPQPFAMLLVHGSQNALFHPNQVESLAQSLSSHSNEMAESVAAALAGNPADSITGGSRTFAGAMPFHVSWLKSGHEIVQERAAYLYNLLRQMILLDPRPDVRTPATSNDARSLAAPTHHESIAVVATAAVDATPLTEDHGEMNASSGAVGLPSRDDSPTYPQDPVPSMTERVRSLLSHHGLKWIQQELYDRGVEGSGTTDAILKRYEQVLEEEEVAERQRVARIKRQQAKHREVEMLRLEKQRAEIERQTRDKETALSIKRKEVEQQRAFFEQMEAQKLAQARMREEQQSMALEDVLSVKYENHVFLEEERRVRNDSMAQQVEEIEAEREEVDRSNFQIQLQQERLTVQQQKRESLKQFQKAFEQNELVSNAVDAYRLDAIPVFEHFAALADGARLIAKDLAHFYELKEFQKDESAQRRFQLEKLREELAAKLTSLRNTERVLAKAKSTGMIAKAGLGTVRIVAITQSEMTALARDLDELRDVCERMQHDVGLRTQELSWKDQLLQRLSVLIKRNEGFRAEMLVKLSACLEHGNDKVLLLREDEEQMMERLAANRKLLERLEARLQAVVAERERAEQASTEYFDTRLRVEGSAQRVLRSLLIHELSQEASRLEARTAELKAEEPSVKRDISANRRELNEAAGKTFDVQCALEALTQAIHNAPGGRNCDRKSISSLENPIDASADVDDDDLHVSERVRRKHHADRSPEERQWVAMDFALNFARYYKTISPEEVEQIAKNTESVYKCALAKEQLERLMGLPARNCLALAFLKSNEELEAHALLRKFSFGDGEDHFAQLDKQFVVSPLTSTRPVATSLEALASTLEKETVNHLTGARRKRDVRVAVPRDRLALLDEGVSSPVMTLFSAANATLDPHNSTTHTFRMPVHSVGVLALTVSIVFQGTFKPAGYQNGRLSAMLYVIPPFDSGDARTQAPLPVGKCFFSRDIALCTPHSLGRLVVRHEPDVVPLCHDATYQVVLGAPVRTRYSIDVTARTALYAGEALQRKKSDALKKQELLPLKRDEIQNVFTTIQLSERKKRLARTMANEVKDAGRAAELELLRATRELEKDNATPQLSNDQRLALHRTIHDAEARFTENSFRYAKREEEVRDIDQCLHELTRIHVDLLDECEQMERDLADYRECLPRIAAALSVGDDDDDNGDVAGARMAKALNVEYESIGARSAKLRWAELSAMKAKLPSMMTPAERLRRKYKKGHAVLEKKEREWILLDRILHPRLYDWEERLSAAATGSGVSVADVTANYWRMRLHGTHTTLSKDEQQLAVLSKLELERIMSSPWNLLERKEIQIRKIVTRFRDDYAASGKPSSSTISSPPTTMVAFLRAQKWSDLTAEEREWRQYDRVLNPAYYRTAAKNDSATRFQQLAQSLKAVAPSTASSVPMNGGSAPKDDAPPPLLTNLAREDLVAALNTPEEEVFTLPSDVLRARTLLLKFDPQLSSNLLEAARVHLGQQAHVDVAETDVDARCRLVYDELQRAIANTRNEFMDSSVLHSTLQRFPTKVLRLELEKDLDRLLKSQITEREEYELRTLFLNKTKGDGARRPGGGAATANRGDDDSESVSESDSDEEAVIAREARDARRAKLGSKNANARGKTHKQQSIQRQRRRIRDVRSSARIGCRLISSASLLVLTRVAFSPSAGTAATQSRGTAAAG